jgi:MarR family transcriptional regulator, lower aerobic nicotinate degradation pathway regulator
MAKKKNMKPEAFQMETHPFFWFGQIFCLRNRTLNRELRPYDLDYQRLKVLGVLDECPNCSMQRLADLAAVDRTSLTHTVQLLVASGLVERRESSADRRVLVLELSAAGHKMFKRIAPMILQLNKRTMAGFTAKETAVFLVQLRRMTENLKDES